LTLFNIASDNYTVGQVGDIVRNDVARLTGKKVKINILDKRDFRNYKVSFEKVKTFLGYMPRENVSEMIDSIYRRLDEYGDLDKKSVLRPLRKII
jgi:hypothetical protein